MRFGVTIFSTDLSMPVTDLAVAAEDRGFDSLWIPEHTHIPTSRRTPPPTGRGFSLWNAPRPANRSREEVTR